MSGTADHGAVRDFQLFRRVEQLLLQFHRHADGRNVGGFFPEIFHFPLLAYPLAHSFQPGFHSIQAGRVDASHVHAQLHLAGDDVQGVGVVGDDTHGGYRLVHGLRFTDLLDFQNDLRCRAEGIGTHTHGRGAGVLRVAVDVDVEPAGACDGLDNAHLIAILLQHLSLLDMELDIFLDALDALGLEIVSLAGKYLPQRLPPLVHCIADVVLVYFLCDQAAADGAPAKVAGFLTAHGAHPDGQSQVIPFGPV